MSDSTWMYMSYGIVGVVLMVLFPAGRTALAAIIGLVWKGFAELLQLAGNHGQAFLLGIWSAHVVVAKNFLPRNAVLPSVREKTVRRS